LPCGDAAVRRVTRCGKSHRQNYCLQNQPHTEDFHDPASSPLARRIRFM
jgi:hypothetical protein